MIYSIENKDFSLAVKEMGAELNSFKSKKTGFEFIWGGNTDIWYGQSPILFLLSVDFLMINTDLTAMSIQCPSMVS